MFRKQMRLLALLLMLVMLGGCSAQSAGEAKILQDAVKTTSSNVKTAQAEIGSLQREHVMSASVTYAKKTSVRLRADEAQFVEHKVSIGQEVKAGDVISVFQKKSDNIRINEIGYTLKELESTRKDGLEDRAEQMEALQERMEDYVPDANGHNDAQSDLQLQLIGMEMEKLKAEQERFLLRLSEQERQLKEEREKLLQAEEELVVLAPVDGFISNLQYMTPGQSCARGQLLAVINDPTQIMLVADAGLLGQFRMGQSVELQYGRFNSVVSMPGHVVSADNLLPPDLKSGKAYIALDMQLSDALLNSAQVMQTMQGATNIKVTSEEIDLRNVLIVPRDAVQYEGGKPYVELVDGAGSALRYVQEGPSDREYNMILAGLEPGDTVIVK